MRYSVVIPVYRVEDYLPACLDSVLAQETESAYEILLIDDGSPDRCGEICDQYAAKDPRIRVLHIENQGVSHARNLGIQTAQGDYVLFLDADDLWEPGLLQTLDRLTETAPDMTSLGCARFYEDGRKEPYALPLTPEGESGADFLQRLFMDLKTPWYFTWSYGYRREFLLSEGLYFPEDMKVSEDFVQIMNAIPKAKSIIGCDLPIYLYRMREGSVTSSVTPQKLLDNLTSKAAFFHKYPTAAMANLYANNALLITRLCKSDRRSVMPVLKKNRVIWKSVSEKPLKLARLLTACFGDYGGVVLFDWIRTIVRFLQGRSRDER